MKAQVIKFPNRFLPAIRQTEPCDILILPVIRVERDEYECPKIALLRRQSKMLREHFKRQCRIRTLQEALRPFDPKFSGGTCSGGDQT